MDQVSPKVGIGAIVIKENKVLLGKRKNSHGDGSWSFPGGHLELFESWENCALRETLEETGLKIKNIRFAAATNDIFHEEKTHYVTIFMLSEYDSGELKIMEPNRCDEWKWFEWNNLPEPLFLPIVNLLKNKFNPIVV